VVSAAKAYGVVNLGCIIQHRYVRCHVPCAGSAYWLLPGQGCCLLWGDCKKACRFVDCRRQAMLAAVLPICRYRKLFVLLSSYTYVNRLQPMAIC
jgi:hypothetical protein